ncbi:hypothetical protein C8R48DRAFT_773313 [Suillus tomentosus]|nr:hypothetical protein C8R48DRAFT_773313 [Suillus tomentosus]
MYSANIAPLPSQTPAVAGTLAEDDHADFASPGYNNSGGELPVCAWCHRSKQKCSSKGSAPVGRPKKALLAHARHARSQSHCHRSPSLLAPQHSENPVVPTPAVPDIPNIPGTIQILPTSSTATDDVLWQEVQALCENELAEAKQKLVQQQARFDFITEELADLRWHMLLLPMVPPLAEHEAATEDLNDSADEGQPTVEQGDASAEQGEGTSTGSEANV